MKAKNSETQTLTKADIIDHLVVKFGFTRQQGRMLVDSFFDEIYDNLVGGKDVKLSGFGNFILKDKKSRPGRNPKTGEEVEISARRVVTFKAGQKLRRQVDESQLQA
ncbi:integration host factor subunit alpha [Psychrobacter sp. YP14]|jgi:integration host factor subunit alpha|uniref:Integration host factor subunit alpha n=3 Tax=Psychrobacter TaxID=497 RepID=A0A844M1C6_9GAMM|nr:MULTISPECIES: integration host factor subunit alpha [Psychrobacter]AWT50014.1 integration host factor subunit alpha [Psychrobacter sp. YP14]MUG32583.1 integration host factor subunit alpha [Psychrobacter sanguinis]